MGESFGSAPQNVVTHTVMPQPTPSLVTEDDDEPPSSGLHLGRSSQIESSTGPPASHSAGSNASNNVIVRDFATPDDTIKLEHSDSFATTALDSRVPTTTNGLTEADLEKHNQETRRRRKKYRLVKLSPVARIKAMFTPKRPIGPEPTYLASLKAVMTYSPLNFLLLFIPVSWALNFTNQNPTIVFVTSALGIIPLAALLGLGTEQIALRTSQSAGGLLNASLGNLIELIISGIALKHCELELIQSALLGGLLSNLLLVLGSAFIIGGFRFHQQQFQPMVAQLNSSLLILSVVSLVIPQIFHQYLENRFAPGAELTTLLQISRGSAIILILIYIAYLFFQFGSHHHLFLDTLQECSTSSSNSSKRSSVSSQDLQLIRTITRQSTGSLPMPAVSSCSSSSSSSDDEPEQAKMNAISALSLLLVVTVFAYITADHLVGSLEGLVEAHPSVSKEWITLIIIPIISNAAEHTTALIVARKGKFDLAMSVAVGSCVQIAFLVIPILVVVAWGMGKPLTLLFDPLETVMLFFSVLIVKFVVEDGKSHWMSGFVLISFYILLAVSFWHFPGSSITVLQGEILKCA